MSIRRIVARLYRQLPIVRELNEIRTALWRIQVDLRAGRAIRLLDFDLPRHPRYGDPVRLLSHQCQVCSQNGEDGIIHEIFRRIGTTARTFAEVGIGDGRQNNTAFLLSQGWTGFWIEGDDGFRRTLENREDLKDGCLKYLVRFVSKENIAGFFEELGVPKECITCATRARAHMHPYSSWVEVDKILTRRLRNKQRRHRGGLRCIEEVGHHKTFRTKT